MVGGAPDLLLMGFVAVGLYLSYTTGLLCNVTKTQALCPGGATPAQQKSITTAIQGRGAALQQGIANFTVPPPPVAHHSDPAEGRLTIA